MSGTNRLIVSTITGSKGSESTLTKALSNANEMALKGTKQSPNKGKVQKKTK